jgi:hypothetical protein
VEKRISAKNARRNIRQASGCYTRTVGARQLDKD